MWEINPADAGTIDGTGMTATVEWTVAWEGTAYIKVKGVNDCGEGAFSEEFEVLCSICTGIDEETLESEVQIFPNPNKGMFNLNIGSGLGKVHVTMLNLLNEVIYENEIEASIEKTLPVDVSKLSKGIYLINFKAGDTEINRKVVIH